MLRMVKTCTLSKNPFITHVELSRWEFIFILLLEIASKEKKHTVKKNKLQPNTSSACLDIALRTSSRNRNID